KWWERLESNHIIAFGTIGGTIIAAAYLFFFVTQHRQEHRPIVAFSRPIELLEPFVCDSERGGAHFGHGQAWIKNVGNAQAKNVFPYDIRFRFVPSQRTGNRLIDDPVEISEASCEQTPKLKPSEKPPIVVMAPGEEDRVQLVQ